MTNYCALLIWVLGCMPGMLDSVEDTGSSKRDPFAARPDQSEGLINTSHDVDAVLDYGAIYGACEAYASNPDNRRLKLLCGKWMFFYEGFGTEGIPTNLIDWVGRNFQEELGPGFSEYGLVLDPYVSTPEQPRYLGLGEGAHLGVSSTQALTCASCHFGQLPDGRYSVGYPNLQYEYGTHMLALFMAAFKAMPGFKESDHHPDAIDAVRPVLDRFDADPMLGMSLMWDMLPVLVDWIGNIPSLSYENEGRYAAWLPGTMDFTMAPLPIEDEVHTVSRILPLWGIPTQQEEADFGMNSSMLAWTGAAHSLNEFLGGFVVVGGGPTAHWGEKELEPLREYLESLEAPEPLLLSDSESILTGKQVFRDAGCQDCHAGPRGSGLRIFEFEEVGTDPELAKWGDGDGDGELCCGLDGDLTGGVKAPRLNGLHALSRFLHNGSVSSLEELLCIDPRPPSLDPPYANTGHLYGCDLGADEKKNLMAFLKSL